MKHVSLPPVIEIDMVDTTLTINKKMMKPHLLIPLLAATLLQACVGGFGTGPGGSDVGAPRALNFDDLYRHWVNAYEEEGTDGVKVYRPDTYRQFPPSRFRMAYVFRQDSTCDWFYLDPADAHQFRAGTWARDGQIQDVIHINQGGTVVSYRIVELTQDILRFSPVP